MSKEIINKIEVIFKETYGYIYPLPYLHRISKDKNSRFQLVYTDKEHEIIIIDLYHLLIPAIDYEHKETQKNPELHYEKVMNYNYNLNNVFIDN